MRGEIMGKIVMPKNSALLDEVEAVLKIYYEAVFVSICAGC